VDGNGVELATATFPNKGSGYGEAVDLLATHRVGQAGVEGTASWGQHVAIALGAAGLDVREVPAQRSSQQRRARRLAKPMPSTRSPRPGRYWPSPPSGPPRPWRPMTPSSPRSKPCSSTVAP
jgi:hypothetical protein